VIEITVKEIGYQQYQIKPNNYFMDLPFDILINGQIEKKIIGKEGIKIKSNLPPTIDPIGFYLKRIVYN
jgi:hypothetical protein